MRIAKMPLYEFKSYEQLHKAVFWAFFPEYLSLPLFFYLGEIHAMAVSYSLQALFLAGSSYLQLSGLKLLLNHPQYKFRATPLLAPLQSVMGVPVKWLGVRKWQYDMVSLAPNYLQIMTTVQAIAAVGGEYQGEPKQVFEMRWQNVAGIGRFVAYLGLVNVLKLSVVANLACHLFALVFGPDLPTKAEAANLLFLEKATNADVHIVRTLAAPVVKVPMIWMKVTLLSLLYDTLVEKQDWAGFRSLVFAILLAFYGLVPILPGWASMIGGIASTLRRVGLVPILMRRNPKVLCDCAALVPLLGFGALMLVVLAHFFGIFACASHDLSLSNGGCTETLNMTLNATNASGF